MIFYFSGTGNTKWAAERLAERTNERLLFIPKELETECKYKLKPDERIGFCFPVHGWQPPRIVRSFVSRLRIDNAAGHYAYILCTCGDSSGLAVKILTEELKGKGVDVVSCQSLIMPESYVCLPFMYTDKPEREHEKISQAEKNLERFSAIVMERRHGYSELTLGLTPWTFSHVIGAYFNQFMISDSKFTVDEGTCIHCGRCSEVCPVSDIVFNGIPTWKNDSSCTCCLSCYHHCPVHAINYGRITRQRGQYYFGHR